MLSKRTSKNQITLPKSIAAHFPDVDYFDIREENGKIILVPLRPSRADDVRAKLDALGLKEKDVEEAVKWARRG